MNNSKSTNKLLDKMMSMAGVVGKLSHVSWIEAIQNGMIATTAPILIGSIFLILSIFAQPDLGNSKTALLPFLAPYATQLNIVNSMTLGFVGLYAAYGIAKSYGEILNVDTTQSGLLGLISFFFITYSGPDAKSMFSVTFFGTTGLFAAMIVSLLSVKLYAVFLKHNITIKLPSSVPPKVGSTFASLIPMTVVIVVCWSIRTLANFNFTQWLTTALAPVLNGSDSLWGYTLITLLVVLLWSIGLNGPAMLGAIITPITTADLVANAAAKVAGNPLPHIWTNAFQYSFIWIGAVFPVVIWYILSKNKGKRALGVAAAPALFFNIIEPTMFGSPVAMNPVLMIPFIFNGVVGCMIGYISVMIGFVARPFAEVPWATPAPFSGVLITGDWKILIVQALVLAVGLVTYYPFIRMDIENSEKIALKQNMKN
ncbi:PTS sugar transporter subunit IIC [Pediococcus cellicola]|uniref:Permease IIC component n=1 Tax=Pediococcus cellicola TaxID=319652 RepID=A0A0R2IKX3_9LACO|nr:PTS transporter subunit EIIC [Pediococcus cellicola]KRN65515.1 PTS family oligomeric beta-glucoside porter component IIC [Pediococcus cellicola]GEL15555.1 permease IIC component [Pediococcus cellicola]